MIVSLLLAASENNVIGNHNRLPWHLPQDLKYFKNLTWGLPVLMGRKTFDSIGKPLPGRKSIVLTRQKNWQCNSAVGVHSMAEAIQKAMDFGAKEIFVIGGAEIFQTALPVADRIYLTRIHHTFDGDVFFSGISAHEWRLVSNRYCAADEKNPYNHTYQVWEKKKDLSDKAQ